MQGSRSQISRPAAPQQAGQENDREPKGEKVHAQAGLASSRLPCLLPGALNGSPRPQAPHRPGATADHRLDPHPPYHSTPEHSTHHDHHPAYILMSREAATPKTAATPFPSPPARPRPSSPAFAPSPTNSLPGPRPPPSRPRPRPAAYWRSGSPAGAAGGIAAVLFGLGSQARPDPPAGKMRGSARGHRSARRCHCRSPSRRLQPACSKPTNHPLPHRLASTRQARSSPGGRRP